jgi:hypothetical protein
MGIASGKKVADITLGELKELIKEVMLETLDPDYGLELQDEVVQALRESFQEKERGEGIALLFTSLDTEGTSINYSSLQKELK